MAVLRYWDGAAWQAVDIPAAYATNNAATARATTTLVLTTTAQAIVGATLSITAISASERFLVVATFDMNNTSATSSTAIGRLYLDGAEYNANMQALYNGNPGTTSRACITQHWLITGLSPGSHTFALWASMTAAGGAVSILQPHTGLSVVSLGTPPLSPGVLPPESYAFYGAAQTIVATSFSNLPNRVFTSLVLPAPAMVAYTFGAWFNIQGATTAVDLRLSVALSGATTLAAGPGPTSWGDVPYATQQASGPIVAQQIGQTRWYEFGAGTTTVEVQAYKTGTTGTAQMNYATLTVVPIRWL